MEFVRLGGLSAVKYDKFVLKNEFHRPPKPAGVYAFIYPYIESFLCRFNDAHDRELKIKGFRRFQYDGLIWCHINGFDTSGDWFLTTTENLQEDLKKIKHQDIKSLQQNSEIAKTCNDPYKRGRGGFMSKDHLEVFIEKKYLGKIR